VEAVNDTFAEVLDDAVADTPVGALGVVTIDDVAEEAPDVPFALVAVATNVYEVPDDNPDTVIGDDVPVAVIEPGVLVTV
jgi:hypothetical protein